MKNIAIIDIDGVIADYRLGLLWWVNANYPELRETCYTHLSKNDTWINYETMKVSFRKWLDILEQFRMSGGKLTLPIFPFVSELFSHFHEVGYKIVLITSRPVDICPNIYHDTVAWLRDNNLSYHSLLWSKNKAEMVYRMRMIDECALAIDDEVSHVVGYVNLNIKTYWINHYNKDTEIRSPYLYNVSCIKDIVEAERRIQ